MRGRQLSREVPGRSPALPRIFLLVICWAGLRPLCGVILVEYCQIGHRRFRGVLWLRIVGPVPRRFGGVRSVLFVFALRTAIACTVRFSAPRGAPRPLTFRYGRPLGRRASAPPPPLSPADDVSEDDGRLTIDELRSVSHQEALVVVSSREFWVN